MESPIGLGFLVDYSILFRVERLLLFARILNVLNALYVLKRESNSVLLLIKTENRFVSRK